MLSADTLLRLSNDLLKLAMNNQPMQGNVMALVPVEYLQPISEILLAESIRLREEENRV